MIINDPPILAAFAVQFEAYEAALTANDIVSLDRFFWSSPLALRFGAGENLYGFDAIAKFRQARQGGSPPRRVIRTVLTTFGADLGTANAEFVRDGEERIGRQSQTWVRFDIGWRIVAAHISFIGSIS
jgi:hypothetical protein